MRAIITIGLCLFLTTPLFADVVRPAPEFGWMGADGKAHTSKSLRGKPVVLLVAPSARSRAFRKQVSRLEELYNLFAAREVIFVAALTGGDQGPVRSDIPFLISASGTQTAQAFGANDKFNLIILGKDGNIDLQTDDVQSAERVRDVITNSFEAQKASRN